MSKSADKRRFVPEPVYVWLGQDDSEREYAVTPAAWVTLYKLKDLLRTLLQDVTDLWNAEIVSAVKEVAAEGDDRASERLRQMVLNESLWTLVDELLRKPQEFIKLAIPDLDESLFDDENPKGATIPQVWATFEVIASVNRLDFAKNLLGGRNPRA